MWNLFFVTGIMLGGYLSITLLQNPNTMVLNPNLSTSLQQYGITNLDGIVPSDLFNWTSLFTLRGFILIVVGGFLVGFGTRYAGGCTSGHAISGLSNFQWPSLIATCCFMAGGFIMSNLILPFILQL